MAWNQGSASGDYSTAFGLISFASGTGSTAFGWYSGASGNYSTAAGYAARAGALDSFVIGTYNIGGGSPTAWVGTDPLFEIGNGGDPVHSDALVVYKNGNTVVSGTLSVSGTSNAVLINPVGDLSMGPFTDGAQPQ